MKGILKIYHPEETLRYNIQSAYCKAVYNNEGHTLELELITDDALDHVEDDSLQYHFPKIYLNIFDFPLKSDNLDDKNFVINDTDEDEFTEIVFENSDEDAFVYDNHLAFSKNENDILEVVWKGKMDDVYTDTDEKIDFKLKCNFKEDGIEIDED